MHAFLGQFQIFCTACVVIMSELENIRTVTGLGWQVHSVSSS
jgi:hypothetical protein